MPYTLTVDQLGGKMKILIYGDPGVGKTAFAASSNLVPELKRVLFLNVEGGLETLDDPRYLEDVVFEDIRSIADLENVYVKLRSGTEPRYEGIKTVIIDTLTELQFYALDDIVRAAVKKDKNRDDLDFVYQDDYGKNTRQMSRLLRAMRDLPCNVIYTAHQKDYAPQGSKNATDILPKLTKQLATYVESYMDHEWFMYTKPDENGNINRYFLTQKSGIYHAKTRGMRFSRKLGQVVVNPTMPMIMDAYRARAEE